MLLWRVWSWLKGEKHNDYSLTNARKAICKGLQSLDKDMIKTIYMDESEEYQPYYNIIKWYYNSLK